MKIAILTSVIGLGGSKIYDPEFNYQRPGEIDYYAFVDFLHPCQVWRQINLSKFSIIDQKYQDRRNAKLPKVLGSLLVPGYDFYIWHDNYAEVRMHPHKLIQNYLKDNYISVFRHPQRNCAYQEIETVTRYGVDLETNLTGIKSFFQTQGFPENQGLFELSSFIYRNNLTMTSFMLSWWELICKYTSRDQITFPYLLKKYNVPYAVLPGSGQSYAINNEFFPQVRRKGN